MKRNYNLELRLHPPSQSLNTSSDHDTKYHNFMLEMSNANSSSSPTMQQQEQKQMTIFYNGQMSVSNVTEFQARTIILLASREIEERSSSSPMNNFSSLSSSSPTTPLMQPYTPTPTDMSMKRSLQRFLQKRKHRAQAASPYHH